MASRTVSRPPSGRATVQVRSAKSLSSTGLSIRYWRSGAVKRSASAVGRSWVATRHPDMPGRTKCTATGAASRPRAHAQAAGPLRCAWVSSICA